ncbi:MAG: lysylphosphatidylglycerol synthase transmembrane domain-containing protein [Planctomycetota bacterium]|jgi:uncharacterized protein (TIRG00374 family)
MSETRPDHSHAANRKGRRAGKWCLLFGKIALAVGLLYWLFANRKLDVGQYASIISDLGALATALAGVAAIIIGQLLMAVRLRLLLKTIGVAIPVARTFQVTAIGSFSGAFLPGMVGGDVVRAVLLCQGDARHQRTHTVAIVIIDRIIGVFSLFLLATIGLPIAAILGVLPFWSPLFLAAPVAVGVISVVLMLLSRRRSAENRAFLYLYHRLPPRFQRLISAFRSVSRDYRTLGAGVCLSLANHALGCGVFALAGVLLAAGVPVALQFILTPLAMAMNMIPLTPGGLGLAEGAFSYLYQRFGETVGADIGLLGRLIMYVALVGIGLPSLLMLRIAGKQGANAPSTSS